MPYDYKKRNADRRARYRIILHDKKDGPCVDCNIQYPYYVMQFDHRDRSTKFRNVAKLNEFATEKKLLEEIDKCDLVCANCHAERTHNVLVAQQAEAADLKSAECRFESD